MNQSIGQRIKQIRVSEGLSRDEFGASLGVSRDVINNVERARVKSTPESLIRLICKTYNVNYSWLAEGIGEMCPPETEDDLTVKIVRLLEGENETAKKVFQAFAAFGEDDWKTVQKFIDGLVNPAEK